MRAARVSERAGLFRVGARVTAGGGSTTSGAGGAGLYALPIQELCAGAWAMRPLQDCKHARLPRTKTAHYFDLLETGGSEKVVEKTINPLHSLIPYFILITVLYKERLKIT